MKRILGLFVLICTFTIPVAAYSLPDLNQSGSISVSIRYDDAAVSGGELTLYRVGDILEDDGNYGFALTEQFSSSGATLENLQSADTAKKLSDYALRQAIGGNTGKIGNNGTLTFDNLKPGLYLLAQYKAAAGYQKLSPFLVSVPIRGADGYSYQVDASPKLSPIPSQPENTDQPETGQSAWPIWVFGLSAAALVTLVCYRKHV